ncbi:aspartate aminotransferase family protein [Streptomyces yaizuensis]|uniref:Aminotransferase class III-fold pyridoxal phosphate-dependent enzyme n=1 Tax=Streptomyces yaizuensis TaxID=2989713 RepID=A0ABQ5NSD2_9ACTN|nr:aminotransferase class III-fold pyridoxal phosphate-dependent enzyme [Streptomyces sp. YSPA8]GLF93265.1 aminotransferase class III-fold pyridoxal phosphate-dependent enzyme [Streptomyces sp. YSPA8]
MDATNTPPSVPTRYAERFLEDMLSAWCLDVEYVRARGDTLFHLDADGTEQAVTDFVGGFGSLLLGHHHPAVVDRTRELLAAHTPVHAQFSLRTQAHQVATRLNDILRREFAGVADEPDGGYAAIFANSGAEAVEAALKHAELERVTRLTALREELAARLREAADAVRARTAVLGDRARDLVGPLGPDADPGTVAGALTDAVVAHNAGALYRPPLLLALTGGFHGKLSGSVQITHNPAFRVPFDGLGPRAVFVPADRPYELERAIAHERAYALDAVTADGVVELVERDVPVFAAMFVEPVLGEGGVVPLRQQDALALRRICTAHGIPLVVDEIQTGAGRCGAFFASSLIGLRGDYVTLAKGIGGGIAKSSVLLVRSDRYRPEFELTHSSTYAKDSLSCSVALTVIDLLEADGGRLYRRAAERGEALRAALEAVRADYPDVVADVRGRGLLLGFAFHDQSDAVSAHVRGLSLGGFFGFAVSGYLLREHALRLMPTGSAPHTLRVEPSARITDAEIARLAAGLRDLCEILRNQDALFLVRPLAGPTAARARRTVKDFRAPAVPRGLPAGGAGPVPRVAYVAELGDPDALRAFDPSLADLDDDALDAFVRRSAVAGALPPLPPVRFRSRTGRAADLVVHPVPAPRSAPVPAAPVRAALRAAAAAGASVIALTARTAAAGDFSVPGVPLTRGEHFGGRDLVASPDGTSLPPGFAPAAGALPGAVAEALLLALFGPRDAADGAALHDLAGEHGFRPAG